jgi:hypothetical protein
MFVKYSKKYNMNSIKSTFLLLFVVVFTFISCDNEPLTGTFVDESGIPSDSAEDTDDNSDNTDTAISPFFANVDGVEFSDVEPESYLLNSMLWVRGTDTQLKKITIGLPTDIPAGTYEIVADNDTYKGIFSDSANNILARANSGSITIIAHDISAKTINGTFNFIATLSGNTASQFEITEGAFNVSY